MTLVACELLNVFLVKFLKLTSCPASILNATSDC